MNSVLTRYKILKNRLKKLIKSYHMHETWINEARKNIEELEAVLNEKRF